MIEIKAGRGSKKDKELKTILNLHSSSFIFDNLVIFKEKL